MTTATAPVPPAVIRIRLVHLYRMSPVGVAGCLGVGLANGSFWSLAPVFAQREPGQTALVAVFMSIAVLAGAIGQWPLGRLSDRMDRRRVIVGASLGAGLAAVALIAARHYWEPGLLPAAALFGAFAMPIYALCAAHLNDHVEPDGYVEASSGLLLAYAAGAVVGPLIASGLMKFQGVDGLFTFTAVIHGLMAAFAFYRIRRQRPAPEEERASFGESLLITGTVSEIDLRAEEGSQPPPPAEAAEGARRDESSGGPSGDPTRASPAQ